MNPYSHLIAANTVETYLQPQDLEEYYLGAVIPDVRYYSNLPREQTHIGPGKIASFAAHHPELLSFILGYLVHYEADKIDTTDYVMQRFPFSLLKERLPRQVPPVLMECYYIEKRTPAIKVSEASNPMLDSLGVAAEDVAAFARSVNAFLANPTLEFGLTTIRELGLLSNPGVEKYVKVARTIQRSKVLRSLLFAGIDAAEIDRQLTSRVLSSEAVAFLKGKATRLSI
jgi:hypothetical protein